MKPGDLVLYRDKEFSRHRLWQVVGVHYGALGQESLIELRNLFERPGIAYGRNLPPTTMVPEPLLRLVEVFTPSIQPKPEAGPS